MKPLFERVNQSHRKSTYNASTDEYIIYEEVGTVTYRLLGLKVFSSHFDLHNDLQGNKSSKASPGFKPPEK